MGRSLFRAAAPQAAGQGQGRREGARGVLITVFRLFDE